MEKDSFLRVNDIEEAFESGCPLLVWMTFV
jgi:hypothetical protein